MARRERTTGLPAPRRRTKTSTERRIAGITWHDSYNRWAILAAAAAVLFVVIGFIAYRWYDNTIGTPNRVVLTVGDDKVKLSYYTDRMYQYLLDAKPQNTSDVQVAQQQLLTQLQTEALTMQLAARKGIKLTDDEITQEIASELGVPVGGAGSSFDTLYREKLKSTKMSDSSYRRMAAATLANKKLLDAYTKAEPDTGELITLSAVVSSTKDDSSKALAEISSGQEFGTVAQKESTDLQSKQNNGIMAATPPALFPKEIQDAIKGQKPGAKVFGPLQVQNDWWIFRIDRDDQGATISADQRKQLAQQKLTADLNAAVSSTEIRRNLTTSDINWANSHANQ
ncbi:SurA N-terminal domain-containing protein [bacterium]|jgi:parvulin-like peptidyl-prolyl isomerase|nr:SurA N-terminal domain-containing protein [bacterium]